MTTSVLQPYKPRGAIFDVGVALPSADIRSLIYTDGANGIKTSADDAEIGTGPIRLGYLSYAEWASDSVYLGHVDKNLTSTNFQLNFQADGDVVLKAPGSATSLLLIAGDSGASSFQVNVNLSTNRFQCNSTGIGFFGTTPAARSTGWTAFSNLTTDKTCDANATTVDELADILGTLIEQLKLHGIIAA